MLRYSCGYREQSSRYARPNYNFNSLPMTYMPPPASMMIMTKSGVWQKCTLPNRDYYLQCHNFNKVYNDNENKYLYEDNYDTVKKCNTKEQPLPLPNGPLVNFLKGSVPNSSFIGLSF